MHDASYIRSVFISFSDVRFGYTTSRPTEAYIIYQLCLLGSENVSTVLALEAVTTKRGQDKVVCWRAAYTNQHELLVCTNPGPPVTHVSLPRAGTTRLSCAILFIVIKIRPTFLVIRSIPGFSGLNTYAESKTLMFLGIFDTSGLQGVLFSSTNCEHL